MPDISRQELEILEKLAIDELCARGHSIAIAPATAGEIDIIAEHGHVVVFVEVKLRTTDMFGPRS